MEPARWAAGGVGGRAPPPALLLQGRGPACTSGWRDPRRRAVRRRGGWREGRVDGKCSLQGGLGSGPAPHPSPQRRRCGGGLTGSRSSGCAHGRCQQSAPGLQRRAAGSGGDGVGHAALALPQPTWLCSRPDASSIREKSASAVPQPRQAAHSVCSAWSWEVSSGCIGDCGVGGGDWGGDGWLVTGVEVRKGTAGAAAEGELGRAPGGSLMGRL